MTVDKSLRTTFNTAPALYHKARPRYPNEIYRDIAKYAAITGRSNLLEIGAGTGIATLPFAAMGCPLICLDIGDLLLAEAKRNLINYPTIEFVNQSFEEYDPHGNKFDLIFSATAFHWLDHEKAYPKIKSILKQEGTLAVFWYEHVANDIDSKFDQFFVDVSQFYIKYMHADKSDAILLPYGSIRSTTEEMMKYEFFKEPQTRKYLFTVDYTADEYIDVLSTYSGHINLAKEIRVEFSKR